MIGPEAERSIESSFTATVQIASHIVFFFFFFENWPPCGMWNSRRHLVYSFPLTRSRFQLLHEPVTFSLGFLVTCCHESSCSYKRLQVLERHLKTAINFSANTTEEKRVRLNTESHHPYTHHGGNEPEYIGIYTCFVNCLAS